MEQSKQQWSGEIYYNDIEINGEKQRSAVHNKNTRLGDVTTLWTPNVDWQWNKGHFTCGVQGNGMGLSDNFLRTQKKLIVN